VFLVAAYFVAESEAFVAGVPSTERITFLKAKAHAHKTFLSATPETMEDGDGTNKRGGNLLDSEIIPAYSLEYILFNYQSLSDGSLSQKSAPSARFYLLHCQLVI
jgi:hypothetical protein